MSLETQLFTALSAIPSFARAGGYFAVSPLNFPQPARYSPEWPAVRYTFVSSVPINDLCGDGDDRSAVVRVQLDVVADTYVELRTLRQQVRAQLATSMPLADFIGLASESEEYDSETKTYRCIMDYLYDPSDTLGSPMW